MEYLLHHQVYWCGTIRSDRKYLPKNLKTEKTLQRREFDYRVSDGGLVFYKWKENKVVTLLSNFHGTESARVLRTQKDGRRINFIAPLQWKIITPIWVVLTRQICWYHHMGYLENKKNGGIEVFLVWMIEHYVMHLLLSIRLLKQKWKVLIFEEG